MLVGGELSAQGDEVRDWGPPFNADGDASYFVGVNRNKRSVGLDLSKPAGREVLMRLLDGADATTAARLATRLLANAVQWAVTDPAP